MIEMFSSIGFIGTGTMGTAVARAAMISGVAQSPIRDMEAYTLELRKRIAAARERVSGVVRSYL